jgi:hypothetical protein
MKVGFSFWGFLTPLEKNAYVNTPDGERGNRVDFVDELLKRGHEVIRLQVQRDDEPYPGIYTDSTGFPDVDVVYCEWRWPTWKNTGPNPAEPDYTRQCEFLDFYHKKGVPIIIHDGDLKMTPEEELRWPNAILSDACVAPRAQTRERLTVPWCNYMKRYFEPAEGSYSYTYVGNNYERDVQFNKYYTDPSRHLRELGIQTTVYGNWLQRSPERKDPRELISAFPFVAFGGRLSYKDIFPAFNASIAVTHITKDDYTPYGNITGRFFEAIKSGVPALIPHEYFHARPVGLGGELLVNSMEDVVNKVKWLFTLSKSERADLVNAQEAALRTVIDPRPEARADLLERVSRGERR